MDKYGICCLLIIINLFCVKVLSQPAWYTQYSGTNEDLHEVQFLDTNLGFVISTHKVLKTTNGGTNWYIVRDGISAFSMWFVNNLTGFVGCSGNILIKTTNSGENWTDIPVNYILTKLNFLNKNTGYACTSSPERLLKCTNSGDSWDIISNIGYITDMFFVNENLGFVVWGTPTTGRISKTTNGGINWNHQVYCTSSFGSVFFPSNNVGYAAGSCIVKTTDGGNSWVSINSDTQGNYLKSIYFVDNNKGFAVGYNAIYRTINGGSNWYLQLIPNSSLDDVYFVNSNTGYIVGYNGLILKTTTSGTTGIELINSIIPKEFTLYQNYPNPFNPVTNIKFGLNQKANIKLSVFDINGRLISTLTDETLSPGVYEVTWDAKSVSSGIYFYAIEGIDNQSKIISECKKMLYIK